MAKAKKLPSGMWRVNAYSHTDENGKQHRVSFTAPSKAEAEMKAAQFASRKKRVRHTDLTVGEAIGKYIEAKEAVLSPSTIRGYARMHETDYGRIENKRVRSLTSEDMQLFISDLSTKKSPKSVRNAYGLLTAAIGFYWPEGQFKVTLPTKDTKRPVSPSDDAIRALYKAAYPRLRLCISFAMCGIRRGEMCAFTYEDIKDGVIHINKDMVKDRHGKWIIKPRPKTADSDRFVTLPTFVLEQIGEGEGRILDINPNTVTKQFIKYRDKLGLDITFHQIRHFFASTAAILKIPDIYTADMGGWDRNSMGVLKSVYQNNIQSMSDYYADKMNKHLANLIKEDA